MSKVDWSLAPEGATHKDFTNHGLWYKFDIERDQVSYWFHDHWTSCGTPEQYDDGSLNHMQERPKPAWSGPQDGLPPVGERVEYEKNGWDEVSVISYFRNGDDLHPVCQRVNYGNIFLGELHFCRAIRTPDQLAAEQRETSIREFMDIVGIDCRVTASKAVDAGFKREVV